MKKAELIAFGIPENRLKEFTRAYWEDVRTSARNLAERERDPKAETIQQAIIAMVNLISDRDKLQKVLAVVNKQYYKMSQEAETMRIQNERGVADCQ